MIDTGNTGPAPRQRVTIAMIAEAAGTSRATVSKALNGRTDVSAATRDSITAIATELGYRPTGAAQAVQSIAFVTNEFDSIYTAHVLSGAISECAGQGYLLTSGHLGIGGAPDATRPLSDAWLSAVSRTHIGVIVATTHVDPSLVRGCGRLGLHLVAVDPKGPVEEGVTTIGATNWNGALTATQHLIGLGHRRIAFSRGATDSVPAGEREQGYRSAMRMAGLDVPPALVGGDDYSFASGHSSALSFLRLPESERPTAIMCASDLVALGAIEACRSLGVAVPRDCSVIGFDDSELAALSSPPLTSVRQPMRHMGEAAARAVIDQHEGRTSASHPMRLETRLVIRDSTCPAPGTGRA